MVRIGRAVYMSTNHRFFVRSLAINGRKIGASSFNARGYISRGPISVSRLIVGSHGRNFRITTQKEVFGVYRTKNISKSLKEIKEPAIEQTWIQLYDENNKCYFVAFDAV